MYGLTQVISLQNLHVTCFINHAQTNQHKAKSAYYASEYNEMQ